MWGRALVVCLSLSRLRPSIRLCYPSASTVWCTAALCCFANSTSPPPAPSTDCHRRTEARADRVVDGVAEHRARHEDGEQQLDVELAHAGKRARGEEQAVAGQERRQHEARLAEHDRPQQGVRRGAVRRDERRHVLVEVERDAHDGCCVR